MDRVPQSILNLIQVLGDKLVLLGYCTANPCFNNGGKYENDTFALRSYCWCDGNLHKDGCPPNFQYNDIRISWYKHHQRGVKSEIEITTEIEKLWFDKILHLAASLKCND